MNHLLADLQRYQVHYLALVIMLGICFSAYLSFWPNVAAQQAAALSLGIIYLSWGVGHHWLTKTLHRHIVLEYFFVSLFAVAVLLLLIQ